MTERERHVDSEGSIRHVIPKGTRSFWTPESPDLNGERVKEVHESKVLMGASAYPCKASH